MMTSMRITIWTMTPTRRRLHTLPNADSDTSKEDAKMRKKKERRKEMKMVMKNAKPGPRRRRSAALVSRAGAVAEWINPA